ncbi:MAG: DUF6356 family protein [Pseudomonadota bacterium]
MNKKYRCKHLAAVQESYWQHFWIAFSSAVCLMFAALVIMIHAILPMFFEYTGSRILDKTLNRIKKRQKL